jgi:hypothetical protein
MERKSKKLIKNLMSNIFGGKNNSLKSKSSLKLATPEKSVSGQISMHEPQEKRVSILNESFQDETKVLGKRNSQFLKPSREEIDDGEPQIGGEVGDCLMSVIDYSVSSNDFDQLEIIEEQIKRKVS